MKRSIFDDIEKNKNDPEKVRLILLTENFAFNGAINYIRQQRGDRAKKEHVDKLSGVLRLPKTFIYMYAKTQKPFLRDIEAQQSIYYVYDSAEGPKNIIDEDGEYIKFYPEKSDIYYKKLIKQLRANYAFLQATEDEKKKFFKSGGHSALHFLDNKRAKKKRHQHGYNFKEDMKIYLECEKSIKELFTNKDIPQGLSDEQLKEYNETFIKHAIDFAAEKLKIKTNRAKDVYYEVCRRYKLPTLNNFFLFY